MAIKCLMNGREVNYPCSAACALFGDCVTAFEAQKKAKPKTNADRIQEKLAETLSGMCKIAEQCDFCPLEGNCPGGSYDLHVWSEWLQQPAEGE